MEKLSLIKFGRQLIESEDLDPIYCMLWKAKLHPNLLKRWLLAYWWFYHAGTASLLAMKKSDAFYSESLKPAARTETQRGTERRHFRGQKCLDCIAWFQEHYPRPESAIEHLQKPRTINKLVARISDRWPMFGPWMAFKVGDMLERLDLAEISFPVDSLSMYSSPTEAAWEAAQDIPSLWSENQDDPPPDTTEVVSYLIEEFKKYKAPPRYERQINAQESETILCKWGSHMHGHYPLMKDTHEIKEGLKGYGELADKLRAQL